MNIDELISGELYEAFDKGYSWSPSSKSGNKELYFIDLPNGHEIAVNMIKERGETYPTVEFTSTDFNPDDVFAVTGTFANDNINPIRVFSSMVQIIKQSVLIKSNGGFLMHANRNEASRMRLYGRMLAKFNLKATIVDDPTNRYIIYHVKM
jgi:hypothetical protein